MLALPQYDRKIYPFCKTQIDQIDFHDFFSPQMPSTSTGAPASVDYQQIFEKNQNLQRQVLKLSEENIELKFETEQARKDVPRLKVLNMLNNKVGISP